MPILTFHLPLRLEVEREIGVSAKPDVKPEPPKVDPDVPQTQPSPEQRKSLLETAVEAVDEVVRPKAKRGRKPKASSD